MEELKIKILLILTDFDYDKTADMNIFVDKILSEIKQYNIELLKKECKKAIVQYLTNALKMQES
jgi:hypothetical protein